MNTESIAEILSRHTVRRDALLPILHDIQHGLGHIPAEAVEQVADALNLSRADVHGVVSFYADFKFVPIDKPIVKLCRAEACQARGAAMVAEELDAHPGICVETIYCFGLCASGPAAMFGDRIVGRLDKERAKRLAGELS